jgi:hypothetical protein
MEQQIQQLINMTEKGLTQLATQLGVSLPQLWEILIKQQYVEAAQAFFGFGICLALWGFAYKKRETIAKKMEKDPNAYNNFDNNMKFALIFCPLLIITIIAIIEVVGGIGKIINPEYYAIQDIVSFINNIRSE